MQNKEDFKAKTESIAEHLDVPVQVINSLEWWTSIFSYQYQYVVKQTGDKNTGNHQLRNIVLLCVHCWASSKLTHHYKVRFQHWQVSRVSPHSYKWCLWVKFKTHCNRVYFYILSNCCVSGWMLHQSQQRLTTFNIRFVSFNYHCVQNRYYYKCPNFPVVLYTEHQHDSMPFSLFVIGSFN